MPCPHNEISIVQRSQQQSAIAAVAYQSGEKLFCEYDQQVKHYPEKRGIVHNEILLPANAPPEYADRNTLWNAAELLFFYIRQTNGALPCMVCYCICHKTYFAFLSNLAHNGCFAYTRRAN